MQQVFVYNFMKDCGEIKLKLLKHAKKHYSCLDCIKLKRLRGTSLCHLKLRVLGVKFLRDLFNNIII